MTGEATDRCVTRRSFLTAAGAAAGALAAAGCAERGDPYALEKPPVPGGDRFLRGAESWVATTCGQCPAGCGVRARVVEGRVVKLEGHPGHPINQGGLGPKGQAGLQVLYNKERVAGPMEREGPRGSGRWRRLTWEEALEKVGERLAALREKAPHGLVVVQGAPRGPMRELWERFLAAFGSPNHVDHRSVTDGAMAGAMACMAGVRELPAFDWERAHYVLGFGAQLFEAGCQSIHFMRMASRLRAGMPGRRVKFVQVSDRFSRTGAKADEWIALRPGTHGALALGLCHVLLREGLFDRERVEEHVEGFVQWRQEVLEGYGPGRVDEATGVEAGTIERLAREMSANRPAVAMADATATSATNGLQTAMAVLALNVLLGSWERPGGVRIQRRPPLAPWPEVAPDETARAGLAMPRLDGAGAGHDVAGGRLHALPAALLEGKPYPAAAVLLHCSNPAFSKPGGSLWIEALEKVPLVVSFSPLADESVRWADFVLPEPTWLERFEVVEPAPAMGRAVVGVRQPAVQPLCDTMATADVLIRLAKAIGGGVAAAFPWESWEAVCRQRLEGLLSAEGGSFSAGNLPDLLRGLREAGAWWEMEGPVTQPGAAFPTPSGALRFPPLALEAAGGGALWSAPRSAGDAADYPFLLLPWRGIQHAEGGFRHLALLRELPGMGRGRGWQEVVDMNPADARGLGVRDGGEVEVESPAAAKRLRVRLDGGVPPGHLGLPLGQGAWPPPAEDPRPSGVAGLLALLPADAPGLAALQGTRARVRRVGR